MSDAPCVSSADCAPSFACVDGMCRPSAPATGGTGGQVDSGSTPGFDAGQPSNDGGTLAYDGGSSTPDAGYDDSDGGGPDANVGADAGGICGQAACGVHGAECGPILDACGAIVDCPNSCESGYRCGEGTFANRCQCEPLSCGQLGAQCGRVTDNCGVSRDCGGCGSRERCNGSNNQCECVPRECRDVGAECGSIDNGCGGTRNCGGCTGPERCGGPGVQSNRCGCTTRSVTTSYQTFRSARNSNAPNGSTNWDDLGNAVQRNGSGADFDAYADRAGERDETRTNYLQLTNGTLGIPSGATILGIQAQVRIKKTGGTARIENLSLIGPRTSDDRGRSSSRFTDSYRDYTFGGPTDLWGRSWTVSELNSTNFGIRLQMSAVAACASNGSGACPSRTGVGVDEVRARVYYEVCD